MFFIMILFVDCNQAYKIMNKDLKFLPGQRELDPSWPMKYALNWIDCLPAVHISVSMNNREKNDAYVL